MSDHSRPSSLDLPEPLRPLARLAGNLWWSWDPGAQALFADLDADRWDACEHWPPRMLARASREVLEARAADADYLRRVEDVVARGEAYLRSPQRSFGTRPDGSAALTEERPVAYLCAEYGLHEALRIYSGGLGVLAGDHLKAASDEGVPLVAVGLFYRLGYVRQRVDAAGEQFVEDRPNDPRELALPPVLGADGRPLEVTVPLGERRLHLRAWHVPVGRVDLYLLDADTPSNPEEDRLVTHRLYGGGPERRIQQELALGCGAVRLLSALGITPAVWHLNEGHASFCALERAALLVENEGLDFETARSRVADTTAFTTHTPVPAGHDRFGADLVARYLAGFERRLGIPWERLTALGVEGDPYGAFNMTHLAVRFSSYRNGVSRIHGRVSRELLRELWPGVPLEEVPVAAITNGVHLPTWTGTRLASALGAEERVVRGDDFREGAPRLDLEELWRIRRAARSRMLDAIGRRLRRTAERNGDSPELVDRTLAGLREDALLVVFARRFAPYKRATLMLRDTQRLTAILADERRPVRIFVAGKSHPADEPGLALIRRIVAAARTDELAGRLFFLEDYDLELARHLVQGADVWLNNPTRPLEASGTSGMKAAANGALNLSIADGWWPEVADGENGWTIGGPREFEDQDAQDEADARALYRLLEEEVVPLFFERDAAGMPRRWLERARHALATIPPVMDMARTVTEYVESAYAPLAARS